MSAPHREPDDVVHADLVIVGAGLAGLSAAFGAAPRRAVVLTKTKFGSGASVLAQGGVAAAVGPDDAPALHASDTETAGAGLSDPEVVRILTTEGPQRVKALRALGARFDVGPDGSLELGREGAHSRRRILHAHGDATGAEMVRALVETLRGKPWVHVEEETFALDLVVADRRVVGVLGRRPDGALVLYAAPAVVIATGGVGRVYARTTNPVEATGDGLAMAARAGARMADLEFVQFHPTALAGGADPMPLLSEALRGEGAVLIDETGRRFMPDLHPQAELAPRDVVARAIFFEMQAGHTVLLDATQALGERFPERFPTVFGLCQEHGFDPRREPVPVSPAAHYHMGGIAVDTRGRASLAGLWACGEVSSTGVHGANRLASNSLLEALVFGARAAEDIRKSALPAPEPDELYPAAQERAAGWDHGTPLPVAAPEIAELRRVMWEQVGLVRDESGLLAALAAFDRLAAHIPNQPSESRNLLTVARLISTAAWMRRESRGGHYRSDYPHSDPQWRRRIFLDGEPGPPARKPVLRRAVPGAVRA